MRKVLLGLYIAFFSKLVWGSEKSLPPLGKRVYLIEIQKPSSPADIKPKDSPANVEGVAVMKDPIPLGNKPILLKPQNPTQTGVVSQPKQISKINFDQMSVKGADAVPRVTFERPRAEVKRRDEPVIMDYRKKVKESESALRQYEW